MALVLEVRYHEPASLRRDYEGQLRLGGLFAAVVSPPGIAPPLPVELVLRLGEREVLRVRTRLAVATPDSIGVELPDDERERLAVAIDLVAPADVAGEAREPDVLLMELDDEDAAAPAPLDLAPPEEEWVVEVPPEGIDVAADAAVPDEATPEDDGTVTIEAEVPDDIVEPGLVVEIEKEDKARRGTRMQQLLEDPDDKRPLGIRIMTMTMGDKIRLALSGDADVRAHLMKERSSAIQLSLLKNPKVGLDEVVFLARSPLISADVVEAISRHNFYGKSQVIAAALVRNPKTPISMAIQLVNKLVVADLRQVAKGAGVRAQIAAAARKRMLGVG